MFRTSAKSCWDKAEGVQPCAIGAAARGEWRGGSSSGPVTRLAWCSSAGALVLERAGGRRRRDLPASPWVSSRERRRPADSARCSTPLVSRTGGRLSGSLPDRMCNPLGSLFSVGKERRPGAAEAMEWLPARVRVAARQAVASWREPLLHIKAPTVVVGAGGSYPAADFVARWLRSHGIVARPAYPLDAEGPESRMLAISYSGTTPDIAEAVRRFKADDTKVVMLVTGATTPQIPADWILYHRGTEDTARDRASEPERGFISFAATLAPCAGVTALDVGVLKISDLVLLPPGIDHIELFDSTLLDVVVTGWAWPAALDLESKWVEAGLGTVRLHESKNLSHGRYQSVLDGDSAIVYITCGPTDAYHEKLDGVLDPERTVRLAVSDNGPFGGLAALNAVQILASSVGDRRGRDISRPEHINPVGIALHDFEWILVPGHRPGAALGLVDELQATGDQERRRRGTNG